MTVVEAKTLHSEPSVRVENPRLQVINIVNAVVGRMTAEANKMFAIEPDISTYTQEQREFLEDFAILQTGVSQVSYGGIVLIDTFPTLRARVWLVKNARQLGVDEGIPSDPIFRHIKREKARAKGEFADRIASLTSEETVIQKVSFSFEDLHKAEYGNRWDERVELEAHRVYEHPWRNTGSDEGNWEKGKTDLERRFEIVL